MLGYSAASIKDSERTEKEFGINPREPTAPAKGSPPFDPHAKYRLRRGPRYELVSEEIEILKRLSDAVTERTSLDATPAERRAAAAELVQEDAELAALVDRLEELSEANDESVARTLESLARKEEGIEDDEEWPPLY